jgi:porin
MTYKNSRADSQRRAVAVLVSMFVAAWLGHAQEAVADDALQPPSANPSVPSQVPATTAGVHYPGVSGESPGYLFDPRPDGRPFGDTLASDGIYLHGTYQQAYMNVVNGGNRQKGNYLGLGYFGFDIDTGKAFGLNGGLIDFTLSTQFGNTEKAGTSTGSQALVPWGFGDRTRLVDLYYDQSLLDGALHITVGRMNQLSNLPSLSPGFHVTPWLCTFWSNSCGTPHAFNFNASHPGYQVGSWGGVITVHPAPFWYIKAGVIENQPDENSSLTDLGWPGSDWGLDQANGAFLPVQFGYVTTPATSLYPTNFHFGGYYDTAEYADKFYSASGRPIAFYPGAPQMHDSATGLFGGIQQTVVRFSDDPASLRGLAVFASGDWDLSGYGDDQQQYEAGFIVTGPFASRAADSVNFLVTHEVFDPRLRASREATAAAHGVAYTMKDQTGLEINYGFTVAPGFVIYPYAQYVINPDQLPLAVPDPHITHATVVGVRITTRFDTLFGLAQPGG